MYVGHFAIGMAIKAAKPRIPTLPILIGVGLMDVIDGLLIITGADRVTANLHAGPYLFFDLTFIDWDHSLLMALVISLLWAFVFWKDRAVTIVAGLACFSHFLADVPMHNDDLALWPFSTEHLGFGLWGKLQTGAWILEGFFALALLGWAYTRFRRQNLQVFWPMAILTLLFINLSPWLSPIKKAALMPEPAAHLVHGALVAIGFLFPALLLTWLTNRAERNASMPTVA